jgi:hypothetical protein
MRRALIGAWLLLTGCSSSSVRDAGPPPDFCQSHEQLAVIAEPELYVGDAGTVRLAGLFVGCDGPISAVGTVSDPSNQTLPVELQVHSMPYAGTDGGLAFAFGSPADGGTLVLVDATFTPDAPAPHQLTVRFMPSLGTFQVDLLPMLDERRTIQTMTGPGLVTWLDLWAGMLMFTTYDTNLNGTLVVRRGPNEVLQVPELTLATSDAGLWVVSPQDTVALFVTEADGGLTKQAETGLPPPFIRDAGLAIPGYAPLLATDSNQLLLVSGADVLLAAPSADGGLELSAPARLPANFTEQASAILLAGEGALIGGIATFPDARNLCLVDLHDGGVSCSTGPGVGGADHGVLWAMAADRHFVALTLSPGPVVSQVTAPFRQTPPEMAEGGVPISLNDTMFFEFIDLGAAAPTRTGLPLGVPFAVSFAQLVRVPVLAPQPAVAGYGRWPDAQPTTLTYPLPFPLSVSEGAVWQYLSASNTIRYQAR